MSTVRSREATEAEAELGFLLRRESCKEVKDSPISVLLVCSLPL